MGGGGQTIQKILTSKFANHKNPNPWWGGENTYNFCMFNFLHTPKKVKGGGATPF